MIKYLDQAELTGKKVLARFDFNTPLEAGHITDTTRVDLALPTINSILEQKPSKLILMSHLGRPKGRVKAELSLEPVAQYLAEKLEQDVVLSESCTDSSIKTLLGLSTTKIVLLQNLRFHPEEEENDLEFARKLASYGEVYINDAFGAAHRKHASVHAILTAFPQSSYAGLLIKHELEALEKITEKPTKPFIALIGGKKVSDKIKTLERLLISVDKICIGGAMAYPFLKAEGLAIGQSFCSDEDVQLAKKILKQDKAQKIVLPQDHVVASSLESKPETTVIISPDKIGLDIGPETRKLYSQLISQAETLFWNGPMGLFENKYFAAGSLAIAQAFAHSSGFTFVGGGDSVSALKQSGLTDQISHVSTGGGASLEYIEKGRLPGIDALRFGVSL